MTDGGLSHLRTVLRRGAVLIGTTVLIAIALSVGVAYLKGPLYQASADVLIDQRDLGASLTGASQAYVDPTRAQQTELKIANSGILYERAVAASGGNYAGQVSASGDVSTQVITFTGRDSDPAVAIAAVKAVSEEFTVLRAELKAAPIRQAIKQVTDRLASEPTNTALRSNLEELRVLQTLNSGNATIIRSADSATKVQPAPVRAAILGGGIGLLVGLLTVGIGEALNTRIRSFEEAEDALGDVPLAGAVPRIRGNRLLSTDDADSALIDSYALILADVQTRLAGRRSPVLLFTSSEPDEGKTTTVANLGAVAARAGQRVLLVDGDARKASLTRRLNGGDAPSRAETPHRHSTGDPGTLLWSVHPGGDALSPQRLGAEGVVATSGASTLLLLAAGSAVQGGGVAEMGKAIARLRDDFDLVLVDGPPALSTADASQLARRADAVVLVVRSELTSRARLRRLLKHITTWDPPLAVGILTGSREDVGYGYYGAE